MQKNIFLLLLVLTGAFGCKQSESKSKEQPTNQPTDSQTKTWWKEAVVYQIYPRSFADSDGDGIGDIKGIISKLDYIKSLGVDVVWLNPIYTSPNADNGYDVSDYENIGKEYGTMQDFDALLKGMHERGIKLVMDMVVNHSSMEHKWFKASRSSRTNPYRDYYHWWPAEKGKPTPRWSFFDVDSDAWKYDSLTKSYYLHYFSYQQPDLNWENPQLRQEVYKMMRFWRDKGIDGFRMDAFQYASKDTTYPVFPDGYFKDIQNYYGKGPNLHAYIQEMNREVFAGHDIMTVAEGAGTTPQAAMLFVDPARHELDMAYHFEGIDMKVNRDTNAFPRFNLPEMKRVYTHWDSGFAEKGWLSVFLANHDQPRMLTHWGNDAPPFREISSKLLTTFVLTMRATSYYYYGDELGMSNIKFDKIEDYNDIDTRNAYQALKNKGGDLKKFLEDKKIFSRDNGRTPMQWNNTANAGFGTGKPWLKVNPDYATVNVAAQEKDPNSTLNYFRGLIKLRKAEPTLIYGKYTLLDKDNKQVYAYTRELDGKKLLVLLNFSDKPANVNIGFDYKNAKVLSDNYPTGSNDSVLRPYEALILKL